MQSQMPKQFLLLDGKPVLMRTIEVFYSIDFKPGIIVVLNSALLEQWEDLCRAYQFTVPHVLCEGGETRYHSVKNSLKLITSDSITAVHDAARPLISASVIMQSYQVAAKKGSAVAAIKSTDSIRQMRNNTSVALNREEIYSVQTPQTFRSELLISAYQQPHEESFSDDATVVEKAGNEIFLIDGEPSNIKITYPGDLLVAECLLEKSRIKRP